MSLCCCHAAKTTWSRSGSDWCLVSRQNHISRMMCRHFPTPNLRRVQCLQAGPAMSQYFAVGEQCLTCLRWALQGNFIADHWQWYQAKCPKEISRPGMRLLQRPFRVVCGRRQFCVLVDLKPTAAVTRRTGPLSTTTGVGVVSRARPRHACREFSNLPVCTISSLRMLVHVSPEAKPSAG
jgi:hypothetical protein